MTKRLIATALLSTALIGGAAFAQSNQPSAVTPAATAAKAAPQAGEKMMLKGNWRASKLIGLRVYNEANENLGDINELIVDKDGKISAVVVGVGGFLGMGEHDIAVSMDKLKFMETPVRSNAFPTADRRETTTTATTPPIERRDAIASSNPANPPTSERRDSTTTATNAPGNPPAAERRDTATTTTTTAPAPTTTTGARTASTENDWVPDHAVMSGNKEQLKAMPQFKYSDYN